MWVIGGATYADGARECGLLFGVQMTKVGTAAIAAEQKLQKQVGGQKGTDIITGKQTHRGKKPDTDKQSARQACGQTDKLADKQTHQKDKHAGGQTERQTVR